MELEEQQRNIDQQHLIDAVARQHSHQNGSLFSINRDLMRRQMGTPASGFVTPDAGEDVYDELHQRLSDEVARRQAAEDARRAAVARQAAEQFQIHTPLSAATPEEARSLMPELSATARALVAPFVDSLLTGPAMQPAPSFPSPDPAAIARALSAVRRLTYYAVAEAVEKIHR